MKKTTRAPTPRKRPRAGAANKLISRSASAASSQSLIWRARAHLRAAIRSQLEDSGYLELDTPTLVISPGTEVHLNYFATAWRDFRGEARAVYLRSSPELHLKQALSRGVHQVYNLGPCYRNGGELSDWHHPEFTMLEWYATQVSYHRFIDQTEELLRECAKAAKSFAKKNRWDIPASFPTSFRRLTVKDAFAEFAAIDLLDGDPDLAAKALAQGMVSVRPEDSFETAFFKVLIDKIEPALERLGGAVLCDYPASQAALAKVEKGVAKRFEFYVGRVELCNGFLELLGEEANRQRVAAAFALRKSLGYETIPEDEDFYLAMGENIPPCCGNAMGFDRLVALLFGEKNLDRVIPFRKRQPFRQ